MKILITGGSGALGRSLRKVFPDAVSPSHVEMDITNAEAVKRTILDSKPDVLIHTAAMVSVRACEANKEHAININVEGTRHVVDALQMLDTDCHLVYLSTACVFAGEHKKFYTEDDKPHPKNFYAKTKLEGEYIVRTYPHSVIIRTNFVAKERWKYEKAFTDRFGTYLFTDRVAQAIKEIIEKRETGIIHVVGDKRMSMYDLAVLTGSKVGKMTLAEYDGPPVTIDMSLATKRWKTYSI